ncbi:hypothetical protein P175DRAFT_0375822 [Aspergillus ochraceoroseus IBT 24754]|uniref:Uncharacterized protein n=1 Tax=Aspergillus ochraceoroseus IBT 24754 TaxID=1392256 RepID=A0A2T5LN74_9EURO|nr:uncharacterized protein P175DRAFT_0375822 [Aspergillus ochraceoroseus IBT 24754]PTU17735.1 hypothetical protein P175DRAFT_0375822 [Aspergillus ochraceoroseus IBT 24754]
MNIFSLVSSHIICDYVLMLFWFGVFQSSRLHFISAFLSDCFKRVLKHFGYFFFFFFFGSSFISGIGGLEKWLYIVLFAHHSLGFSFMCVGCP